MKKYGAGFTVLEVLLIVIIVGGLSLAGWYVFARNVGNKSSRQAHVTPADPKPKDVTWKEYTAQKGTLHFSYPETWEVKSVPTAPTNSSEPSFNSISVTSPDKKLWLGIADGIQPRSYGPITKGGTIISNEPTKLFSQNFYWIYVQVPSDSSTVPDDIYATIVTQPEIGKANWPISPDFSTYNGLPRYINVTLNNMQRTASLDNLQNSSYKADIKRIVESLSVN